MDKAGVTASRQRLAFLLGDPVEHSLSPLIHNTAFDSLGIDAAYHALRTSRGELPEALDRLRSPDVLGANVTIPYKEEVIGLLDDVSKTARSVGAVNTILVRDERLLVGANTDVEGFMQPLTSQMSDLRGGSAVIFGAGGVARAACFGLLTTMEPRRLTIIARRASQVDKLLADMAAVDANEILRAASFESAGSTVGESCLIVNATSAGMEPDSQTSPWPNFADFHEGQLVYDLVYSPTNTRLIREAAARGAATLGGMAMLLAQAAASFKLWTGIEMPLEAVREALGSDRLLRSTL